MNNRGRLLLSGVISAGIHAYAVIAADPWIDLPRLEPSGREPLQIVLTAARADTPEPQAEHRSDSEPVAPVEDESEDSPIRAEIAPGNLPVHTADASAATPREQVSQARSDNRTAKLVPRPNTAVGRVKVTAPDRVRKSGKTPTRAAAKPAFQKRKERKKRKKRKPKRSAKVQPNKRNGAHGKRLTGTKTRKPTPGRSTNSRRLTRTKAGKSTPGKSAGTRASPKAASNRVRKPRPDYRTNPRPKYPRIARRRGLEGTVVLKVLVNARGRVGGCRVHKSSGHRILDERAMKTVRKWAFEPGRKGAKPSAMWVKVPIRFALK